MMKIKTKWTIAGLGLMLVWLVWELIGSFDNSFETLSFTQFIVGIGLPVWIYASVATIFGAWLSYHFWTYAKTHPHYKKQNI